MPLRGREKIMRNIITRLLKIALTAAAMSATLFPAFAADNMKMGGGMSSQPIAGTTTGYSFELVGQPKTSSGKSTVSVRIVRAADKMPVVGAVIIQSRADMGPMGMATMTAPIKALPSTTPGVYSFEVANGPVWNKPDKWELSFSAKVQGETRTVHGAVVVMLSP
jgi:hypothetical protein